MTPGCAHSPPASLGPVVVETTPIRCPELDPSLAAEAKRRTPRPAPPLGPAEVRAWINKLEVSERRKGELLAFAVVEYERCRTGGTTPPSS